MTEQQERQLLYLASMDSHCRLRNANLPRNCGIGDVRRLVQYIAGTVTGMAALFVFLHLYSPASLASSSSYRPSHDRAEGGPRRTSCTAPNVSLKQQKPSNIRDLADAFAKGKK